MDTKNTYKSILLYTLEFVFAYALGRFVSFIMEPFIEHLPSDTLQLLANLGSFILLLFVLIKMHFVFRAWLVRKGWLEDRNH